VNTYLAANLGGKLDALIKDRFGGQPILELQVASNVAEKLVGWSKLFGSILGVLVALIVIILAVLGFTGVSGFRAFVAKKQQEAETSINKAQGDAETSIQEKGLASKSLVDRLATQLEQSTAASEQTVKHVKSVGDEIGQKLQQDRKAADTAASDLKAVQDRAKGMEAELDALSGIQHDVGNLRRVAQANAAANSRLVYGMLQADVTGTDSVKSATAIQILRHILTVAGYKPGENATGQELLASFRQAMEESITDSDKFARLSVAVASANVGTRGNTMVGTVPVPGNLSMSDLADWLTEGEQSNFTQLTALAADPVGGATRNLGTFISQANQLGALAIVAAGTTAPAQGTKVLSATAYISGAQTKIDVYRLPVG
jgi:hypothetical protein